jgi:hypothetical protein
MSQLRLPVTGLVTDTSEENAVALVTCIGLLVGCFGYNSSAKKWSYAADAVLFVAGGAAIGWDLSTRPGPCTLGPSCPVYTEMVDGGLITGIVLATAGLFGIIFNATRTNVKTSR